MSPTREGVTTLTPEERAHAVQRLGLFAPAGPPPNRAQRRAAAKAGKAGNRRLERQAARVEAAQDKAAR